MENWESEKQSQIKLEVDVNDTKLNHTSGHSENATEGTEKSKRKQTKSQGDIPEQEGSMEKMKEVKEKAAVDREGYFPSTDACKRHDICIVWQELISPPLIGNPPLL